MYECSDRSRLSPLDYINNNKLNKELAFTSEERQQLGIYGLLPPQVKTQKAQLEHCRVVFNGLEKPLNKYLFLDDLLQRNEKLFYRYMRDHIDEVMPFIYTPTVGAACQNCGLLYRRPKGLFITIHDRHHILDVLSNWPIDRVNAVVVTDGERILGLGDLGACGMAIPIGKLALYTAIGHVKPHRCLPVTLDVGTNNEKLLNDPNYYGIRQKRVAGPRYDEFLDEFMSSIVQRFGQKTLIQFEDFGNANAFKLLAKYRGKYCMFNDDIQGTAAVCLAALLTCERVTGRKFGEQTLMFFGAGQAAVGIANMCLRAMEVLGLDSDVAREKIWMFDMNGLLSKDRTDITPHQEVYAKDHAPEKNFLKLLEEVKPSVLIGASAVAGAFNADVLRNMGSFNERPIIFALSNPTSNAECTPSAVYEHTQGRAIFCSGSPFEPINYNGKIVVPGQANNSMIFPGLALAVILAGIQHVSDELFIIASHAMSSLVPDENLKRGCVLPNLRSAPLCSRVIAKEIFSYAYCKGIATLYPEPADKEEYIKSHSYDTDYCNMEPAQWNVPTYSSS